jgi:hypothetical protein
MSNMKIASTKGLLALDAVVAFFYYIISVDF